MKIKRIIVSLLVTNYLFVLVPDVWAQNVSGGVGLQLYKTNDVLLVKSVVSAGPAESAGIVPGEKIVSINGTATAGLTMDDAVKLILGAAGTAVKIEVAGTDNATREVSLKRVNLRALIDGGPMIRQRMLNAKVGLLAIPGFGTNATPEIIAEALTALKRQGALHLIIDLRGNTGGDAKRIADGAGLFIGRQTQLWGFRRVGQTAARFDFSERDELWQGNIIVLVDHHTYFGAELFASVLQTSGRAKIWGQTTAGRATAHNLVTQADGSKKIVPAGEFLTATGKPLEGVGVTPDVPVENIPDNEIFSQAIANFKNESLEQVESLYQQGLINKDDYEQKKKEILDSL